MDSFELGSKETFSLDLGEGGGPSDESPAPGGRGGLADLGAPRQPKAAAKAATSVLPPSEDRLLFDDEGLDERFDLQRDSERIQIDSRAVSLRERGVRDAVSELDMTIEDLRAATDMDLDTFVDSSPASGLVEEQERARGGQRAKGPALRSVSTETGVRGEPTDLHGISASQGDSPSSDLLSSQWQMDSGLWDETATKLDLARAYVEMGDKESARGILDEVVSEGNDSQCAEAKALLRQLG
jgi:pilus assembly protein FimV